MSVTETFDQVRESAAWAGRTLRGYRLGNGWTLRACATAAGINPGELSRIETGQHIPDRDTLEAVLRVLQHSYSDRETIPVPRVRTSDPRSSQINLGIIAHDRTRKQHVEDTIIGMLGEWTDSDLARQLPGIPRNIVARYRGWAEEAGICVRVGARPDRNGSMLVHFRTVT